MSQIFLGNGAQSGAECYDLHCALARALTVLGGIQQPGAFPEEIAQADEEIESIARHIYERLTGNKITYA